MHTKVESGEREGRSLHLRFSAVLCWRVTEASKVREGRLHSIWDCCSDSRTATLASHMPGCGYISAAKFRNDILSLQSAFELVKPEATLTVNMTWWSTNLIKIPPLRLNLSRHFAPFSMTVQTCKLCRALAVTGKQPCIIRDILEIQNSYMGQGQGKCHFGG